MRKPRRLNILTDLDLNRDTPLRVQPSLGEWGPRLTPATRAKKRARWLWPIAFCVVVAVIFIVGHWIYGLVMGSGG